jgi:hypothetical protein
MEIEKDKKQVTSSLKKLDKEEEQKVSGAGMISCPICMMIISDNYLDDHLKAVHNWDISKK